MTFGAHKLVRSEPFLEYKTRNLTTLLSALHGDINYGDKKLYRCTSTYSALNYCGGILFKCLSYLYEVGAKTFSPLFGLFTVFDRNLAKIVALPNVDNKNSLAHLKGQSLPKKVIK